MARAETAPPPMLRILKKAVWSLMLLLAALMFVRAGQYLTLDPEVFFPQQRSVFLDHTTGILVHIIGSMLATIIGPFQFLPGSITARYLKLHRWMGRTYLIGVLFGGLGGLYMAPLAHGGFPARLGFALLAIAWLYSGFMAYRHIRARRIQLHRQWMIRNYALTFAAVTLRLWLVSLQGAGVGFTDAYVTVAWLCWVPNLIFAEWMVNRIRPDRSVSRTA